MEPEDTYYYKDEDGKVVLEVHRFPNKRFKQRDPRTPEGSYFLLDDTRQVPYQLPRLIDAMGKRKVFICEGEKDVHAIMDAGGVATCNAGGAGRWRESFAPYFEDGHVIIVVDKDAVGEKHAQQVAATLEGVAKSVQLVQAKEGKDAADHIAAGYGLEDFSPWEPRNGLVLVQASTVEAKARTWVDGFENFVPYAGLSILMGDPGVNKSTLTCLIAAQVSREAGHVLMLVSGEDGPDFIKPRLEAAGADLHKCHFVIRRRDGFDGAVELPGDTQGLEAMIKRTGTKLLVVDPINSHLGGDIDTNNDRSMRSALAPIGMLAQRYELAALFVAHTTKGQSHDPFDRLAGSKGISGIVRCAMLMDYHPEPPEPLTPEEWNLRVLVGWKNNWGPKPQSRVYRLTETAVPSMDDLVPKLEWFGPTHFRARHLLWRKRAA